MFCFTDMYLKRHSLLLCSFLFAFSSQCFFCSGPIISVGPGGVLGPGPHCIWGPLAGTPSICPPDLLPTGLQPLCPGRVLYMAFSSGLLCLLDYDWVWPMKNPGRRLEIEIAASLGHFCFRLPLWEVTLTCKCALTEDHYFFQRALLHRILSPLGFPLLLQHISLTPGEPWALGFCTISFDPLPHTHTFAICLLSGQTAARCDRRNSPICIVF